MKISVIRIPCKELSESSAFYEKLVGLEWAFGSADDGYIGFHLENAQLLLELQEIGEFECGRYLGFSVAVGDIVAFHQECSSRGIEFTGPPEQQAWGGIMTHIRDCNGNTFSVVQR